MKNRISKFLPVIFLLMAITFMTIFKHEDTLSDAEAYEFKSLSSSDQTIDQRAERIKGSDNEKYAITADEEVVTVFNPDGSKVFETSIDDWEDEREFYYEKYNLN